MSVIRSKARDRGLIVDLFAGGGGASMGIEAALGRHVDIAINHDPIAIAVHMANHPKTTHYTTDIWDVKPRVATCGRRVKLLHASPDCKHFSRAKGGKPKSQKVRSLAWVVKRWASDVRPEVIVVENVPEFPEWGPLYPTNTWRVKKSTELHTGPSCPSCSWTPDREAKKKPKAPARHKRCTWSDVSDAAIPERKGETFKRWHRQLERLGYVIDHRNLVACDYGAPTKRKRFFLVARRDGQAITWPTPSHGTKPGLKPYNTAAQCIDFTHLGSSIFLCTCEAQRRAKGVSCRTCGGRFQSLAEKTLKRIAAGIVRFVVKAKGGRPFIIPVNHGGGDQRCESIDAPLSTITAARRGHALVVPFVAGCGGRAGQSAPTGGDQPLGTITAKNDRILVAPLIATLDHQSAQSAEQSAQAPLSTVTTKARHMFIAPTLYHSGNGEREGQAPRVLDIHEPLGTVMAQGQKHAMAAALLKHYGGVVGQGVEQPIGTITAVDHHSLLLAELSTADAKNATNVLPFLSTYYGSLKDVGQSVDEPLRTVVTKDRFALVNVVVDGVTYVITDILMRMLEPGELDRAQYGRFAEHYDTTPAKTKKDRVRLTGNSVCPENEEAVIAALFPAEAARALARRAA